MRILSFFLLIFTLLFAEGFNNQELTDKDIQRKTEEILALHPSYSAINEELAIRIVDNYFSELDGAKIYFLDSEVNPFLTAKEQTTRLVIAAFKEGKWDIFQKIHELMVQAIERRKKIEESIKNLPLPKITEKEEGKDKNWPKNTSELSAKLLNMKSLLLTTAQKFAKNEDESNKIDNFLQLVEKRKLNKEVKILNNDPKKKEDFIRTLAIKSFCQALDSHTQYFTPQEANDFMIQVQQRLFGIGAQLKDNLNGLRVTRLLENGPAFEEKSLKVNDLIVAVNNEPIVGLNIEEAVEKIRGPAGSKVHLSILRKHQDNLETVEITLTRKEIVLEEKRIESEIEAFGDGVIAHCKLYTFYQDPTTSSASDLKNSLEKIQKEHRLKGVILDLRDNYGGLLPQAVEVASLFINKGVVVSIKDRMGNIQVLRNTNSKVYYEGPLLILINRASASAAEIVALSLQEWGRAIVVGDTNSYGKGTFQTFSLDTTKKETKINPRGEYKITRGRYYTVSGKSPQLEGVKSDIVVPGLLSQMEIGEKFSKYPLASDAIAPMFEDNLEDVPPIHREKVALLYKHNLQQKILSFRKFLDILQKNSQIRLSKNTIYQNFLKDLEKKSFDSENLEIYQHIDFQYLEAQKIMQDLIFLIELSNPEAVSF